MLPPYFRCRPPGGTPLLPSPRPGGSGWAPTRRGQQADQADRALDLQASMPALQLGERFVLRAITGGSIQYAGGLMAHNGNPSEALDEVNATAALLAGLPGDLHVDSWRNNLIAAAIRVKSNAKTSYQYGPAPLTQKGALNCAQQVGKPCR